MWENLPSLPESSPITLPIIGDPWIFMTSSLLRQIASVATLILMLWATRRAKIGMKVRRARKQRAQAERDLLEVDSNISQSSGGDPLGLSQCGSCFAIVRSGESVCSRCGSPLPGGLLGSAPLARSPQPGLG